MTPRILSPVWLFALFIVLVAGVFFWPVRRAAAPGAPTVPVERHRPLEAGEAGNLAALGPQGSVWVWGAFGGDSKPEARRLAGLEGMVAVSVSGQHGLALARDGRVWSWGDNARGQLGHSPERRGVLRDPDVVPGLDDVVRVAALPGASLALRADGTVWGWGDPGWGRFGVVHGRVPQRKPVPVGAWGGGRDLVAGEDFVLVLRRDGSVGLTGRLGDAPVLQAQGGALQVSPRDRALEPETVEGAGDSVALAAHGGSAPGFASIQRDGSAWAWGAALGACAEGTGPVRVPGVEGVRLVAVGSAHVAAVGEDGALRLWGAPPPEKGKDGCVEPAAKVAGAEGVVALASAGEAVFYRLADGSTWRLAVRPGALPGPSARVAGLPATR